MARFDVITIGSALMDIYLKSEEFRKLPTEEFESGVGLCSEFGGKMEINELEVTTGGAGTNNAVSFARKDFRTAIVCEMGTDLIGQMIKAELAREGVDLSLVVEEGREETGMASIMVAGDGGKAAAIYRGASKMLTISDMRWDQMDTEWFYISSLGGQVELLEALVNHASEHGIRVALNPGGDEIEKLGKDREQLGRILSKVEVLLINKEELEELIGHQLDSETEKHINDSELLRLVKLVVITNGKDGGWVRHESRCWKYEPMVVETVEETGAGDAFGSGLVAALMKGKSVEEVVEWGKKQAASVVQYMGPKKGLMRLEEISG